MLFSRALFFLFEKMEIGCFFLYSWETYILRKQIQGGFYKSSAKQLALRGYVGFTLWNDAVRLKE